MATTKTGKRVHWDDKEWWALAAETKRQMHHNRTLMPLEALRLAQEVCLADGRLEPHRVRTINAWSVYQEKIEEQWAAFAQQGFDPLKEGTPVAASIHTPAAPSGSAQEAAAPSGEPARPDEATSGAVEGNASSLTDADEAALTATAGAAGAGARGTALADAITGTGLVDSQDNGQVGEGTDGPVSDNVIAAATTDTTAASPASAGGNASSATGIPDSAVPGTQAGAEGPAVAAATSLDVSPASPAASTDAGVSTAVIPTVAAPEVTASAPAQAKMPPQESKNTQPAPAVREVDLQFSADTIRRAEAMFVVALESPDVRAAIGALGDYLGERIGLAAAKAYNEATSGRREQANASVKEETPRFSGNVLLAGLPANEVKKVEAALEPFCQVRMWKIADGQLRLQSVAKVCQAAVVPGSMSDEDLDGFRGMGLEVQRYEGNLDRLVNNLKDALATHH